LNGSGSPIRSSNVSPVQSKDWRYFIFAMF
jgi:hypothetical protein